MDNMQYQGQPPNMPQCIPVPNHQQMNMNPMMDPQFNNQQMNPMMNNMNPMYNQNQGQLQGGQMGMNQMQMQQMGMPMGMNQGFQRPNNMYQDHHGNKDKYKTALCNNFEQTGMCKFGDSCKFAHGQEDIRVPNNQGFKRGFGGNMQYRGGYDNFNQRQQANNMGYNDNRVNGMNWNNSKFRTQICNQFAATGMCKYGDTCKFFHSQG